MSAERATYLDSSAIVKLVVREPESATLRAYLRRRRPLVSSALARTEVARAVLALGASAARRAQDVLDRVERVRVNDRVLLAAPPGVAVRALNT
jgi:predicted nucleic acid-binding protein